ncbi:MAG: aldehyde ferredoxin oxidoreductase family protein [Candidatus Lokiarchaeota archaeon]|nr:aldehyde ferredoxin oxidoreductase family protein [Candidatus Lokiarchaeota archaeon]
MNFKNGKLLIIDLSSNKISTEPLNQQHVKKFLGGSGYACRYLYDKIDKETDPLSSNNILMFMTGIFCGSTVPTSGRFVACSKSPYTGIWGESNCGGFFGPELRKTGYEGIVIKGASEIPVYIEINENSVNIKEASDLWGKGTFETSRILKERIDKLARVTCIGPAGENLVKYATIASEDKALGRTGMGAVMGSKKLKAIVVKGTKKSYEAAYSDKFKETTKNMQEFLKEAFLTTMFGALGTAAPLDMYNYSGELPIKYWTQASWIESYNISGATASEKIFTRSNPCFACPIGCTKKAFVKEGEYKTETEVASPEYETIAGFGSMILNDNLESIVRANYLCNDLGIDTISTSGTIALVYYLYDKGILKSEQINNLEPQWGNEKPMLELIKKIAKREGIGDLLAEGSNALGERYNVSKDDIGTVYGMEVPYHDLRACYGMAVAYGLATPRGPCHNSCDMYNILLGLPLEELGIELIDKHDENDELAKYSALAQDYRALTNSLILCVFANPPIDMIIELISSAIGIECNINVLKNIAERNYTIKRMFNLKMGLTPRDDRLPKILLEPKDEGESAGKSPDFDKLKTNYYAYRQFDLETGKPNREKLQSLDLEDL